MCASCVKVLDNGALTRALLSEYYAGNSYGDRIVWCLEREFVVGEKIALVGVLVQRMPAPHATGDTRQTLEMTGITW